MNLSGDSLVKNFAFAFAIVAMVASAGRAISDEPRARSTPKIPAVGDTFPEFKMTDTAGSEFDSAKALEAGPVVVVVLRGYPGYQCPACSGQARSYIGRSTDFAGKKARVVFIYPGESDGLADHANEFMGATKLPKGFSMVVDGDYELTKKLGLRWNMPNETAYPSTFVIAGSGKTVYAKVSKTHGGRADVDEVLKALEKVR